VLTLAGCSSSTSKPAAAPPISSVPSSQAPAATSAASSATPPKSAKATGIGDTVDLASTKAGNTLQVTLTKVVDPSTPANPTPGSTAGTRYVAVQLRIANKGIDAYNQPPWELLKARDAAGESFAADPAVDTTAGPSMDPSLSLAAGDTTLGYLVFKVPAGQKLTRVQYTLSSRGGAVAMWTIG
jgi:hypothetical protein